MDTALRNRLTGAVLLVLIAVLLLPELLTGSGGAAGKPAGGTTGPAADGAPLTTLQIDLSGRARSPAGSTPSTEPAVPEVELPVPPAAVELPVPEDTRPVPTPIETPVAAVPVPTPAAPKPASPTPAPAVTPTPTPAAPTPAAPAPAVADGATRYYVQVGTFTTRERADAAQQDLARRGFSVIINETTSGERRFHRVRVGPVADRAAAVALEARLRPLAPDRAIVAVPPAVATR